MRQYFGSVDDFCMDVILGEFHNGSQHDSYFAV